jgi:hypothetical protein
MNLRIYYIRLFLPLIFADYPGKYISQPTQIIGSLQPYGN